MAMDFPVSDLSRAISHEPDDKWPASVELRVSWKTKGGKFVSRTINISGDEFFGLNGRGAPLTGDSLINAIERMRRMGAPSA